MTAWRKAVQRIRCEARDALELVLLPGVAMLLPWRLSFGLFKSLARWPWLYRARCERALAAARMHGAVTDPAQWCFEQRLIMLVDHADLYLSRTRSDAWWKRHLDVYGDWGVQPGQAGFLMTFHWAAGMWAQRHARASGLRPHMLVAAVDGPSFAGRSVLRRYVGARMRTVELAEGRPVIYVPGAMSALCEVLRRAEQVLVVMDVPPDQVKITTPLTLLGRTVHVPAALPRLAVERAVPVTVYTLGLDLQTGRRDLRLYPLGVSHDAQALTAQIFGYFEQIVRERPAAWHFWSEADRFFGPPGSGED